jgi:hypothetical protein
MSKNLHKFFKSLMNLNKEAVDYALKNDKPDFAKDYAKKH